MKKSLLQGSNDRKDLLGYREDFVMQGEGKEQRAWAIKSLKPHRACEKHRGPGVLLIGDWTLSQGKEDCLRILHAKSSAVKRSRAI